jgi:hypothetical protein
MHSTLQTLHGFSSRWHYARRHGEAEQPPPPGGHWVFDSMARTGGRWPSFYGEGVASKQSSDVVFRLTFFGEATFRVEGREVDPRRLFIARASAMRAIAEGTAATVLLPRRACRPDFGVGGLAGREICELQEGEGVGRDWWLVGERPPARSLAAGVVEGGDGL